MAFQTELTIALGRKAQDIAEEEGTGSGADAITVNIDADKMTKGDAVELLGEIQRQILEGPWPRAYD